MADKSSAQGNAPESSLPEGVSTIDVTLQKGMRILRGEFVMMPGYLYFICFKDSSGLGAAIVQGLGQGIGLGGLVGGLIKGGLTAAFEHSGEKGARENRVKMLEKALDDKLPENAHSFKAEPKDLFIKRGWLTHTITVKGTKMGFRNGMPGDVRKALKAWATTNEAPFKGL